MPPKTQHIHLDISSLGRLKASLAQVKGLSFILAGYLIYQKKSCSTFAFICPWECQHKLRLMFLLAHGMQNHPSHAQHNVPMSNMAQLCNVCVSEHFSEPSF